MFLRQSNEFVDGRLEALFVADRIAQDDEVVAMRAVQECDVALGGIEDVLVSEEEKMRVLVAAVLGQESFVAGDVLLR